MSMQNLKKILDFFAIFIYSMKKGREKTTSFVDYSQENPSLFKHVQQAKRFAFVQVY